MDIAADRAFLPRVLIAGEIYQQTGNKEIRKNKPDLKGSLFSGKQSQEKQKIPIRHDFGSFWKSTGLK